MTFRSRFAVLALAVCAPALAQADQAALLNAEVEATAAASSDQAVAASIAREDAAIQRAIDRELDARIASALGRPVPVRLGSVPPRAGETLTGRTWSYRRVLYAAR